VNASKKRSPIQVEGVKSAEKAASSIGARYLAGGRFQTSQRQDPRSSRQERHTERVSLGDIHQLGQKAPRSRYSNPHLIVRTTSLPAHHRPESIDTRGTIMPKNLRTIRKQASLHRGDAKMRDRECRPVSTLSTVRTL